MEQQAARQKEMEEAKDKGKDEPPSSRRRRRRPTSEEVLDTHSNLDDQHASNNWVISGKHTKSGLPLLSSDPHLGTGLPSFWTIQHLEYKQNVNGKEETFFVAGGSNPGIPTILIGRTKNISWGITAALTDISDLYREEIDEKNDRYKVDGEWRGMEIKRHYIKVKGQDKTVPFILRFTHRGPVLTSKIITNA